MTLHELKKALVQMVAMSADEERVGCEDGPDAEQWLSDLQDAIDNGLDAAFQRLYARDPWGSSE